MTIQEILNDIEEIKQIQEISNYSEYKLSEDATYINIDDYIVHKIELLNNSFDKLNNTPIFLNGVSIGDIFYLKDEKLEISQMSSFQFYAFLSECNSTDLILGEYIFQFNYLLIHRDFIDEFHYHYSSSSAIWGGFKLSDSSNSISYYKKTVTSINIPFELKELNTFAKDSVYRALDQKHAFERFLKLYHLLELEFDNSLIQKIKSLNIQTDSNQIGSLLNEYNRNEIERLTDLICNNCTDITSLANKLNLIKNHISLGEEIFIKFGKTKNSTFFLNDPVKFNDLLGDPGCFLDTVAVQNKASVRPQDYDKFIHTITAYWIYRIRCSIAHFKIGEFILTRDKEEFIVEFAEPLINEVLIQYYKK